MDGAAFRLFAVLAVVSAVAVVRCATLVRAVLWLGVTLAATAGLYAVLGASFLAGAQILLYLGGVVTLMIFGVMITRRHGNAEPALETARSPWAAASALALFGLVSWAIVTTEGLDAATAPEDPGATAALGRALMRDEALAFEAVSVLLLGAIVGAIVLARRRDPGAPPAALRPAAVRRTEIRQEAAE
jgi:NADH:ubiquinone oxidoreductase subunit 6 (subunit J)